MLAGIKDILIISEDIGKFEELLGNLEYKVQPSPDGFILGVV